jgi:hypothetical protein
VGNTRDIHAAVESLAEDDVALIGKPLKAAATGPFFVDAGSDEPGWEIRSLFGLDLADLREVADKWPEVGALPESDVYLAVSNGLNNLIGYPHGHDDLPPANREDLIGALERWHQTVGSETRGLQ